MITLQDVEALVELADRAPKSKAEAIWLARLVAAVNKQIEEQKEED